MAFLFQYFGFSQKPKYPVVSTYLSLVRRCPGVPASVVPGWSMLAELKQRALRTRKGSLVCLNIWNSTVIGLH